MLTPAEKLRAARMYGTDFFAKLFADAPMTGHSVTVNNVLIGLATGKHDDFAAVRNALSDLDRLERSDDIHNAVQALQYLRGRDRSFNTPHPMGDDPRRFLRVFSPLNTGYVNRHSSMGH